MSIHPTIAALPVCRVPPDPHHIALVPQVPGCCVSCQPTTQTVCTSHCRSPVCPTLAISATQWRGDPLGCPPAGTQPCWLSSSVRAEAWQQVGKHCFGWKKCYFLTLQAHTSERFCFTADPHTKDEALGVALPKSSPAKRGRGSFQRPSAVVPDADICHLGASSFVSAVVTPLQTR